MQTFRLDKSHRLFSRRRGVFFITAMTLAAGLVGALADNVTGTTGSGFPVENHQPTLVMRYIIALQGIFPDDAQSTPTQSAPPDRSIQFLGEIKTVPFDFAPKGWAFCEGQLLPINQNQALYSLIGATYGGNGVTPFALPDLQGRVPIGAGQGPGLPNYTLGQQVGTANPILSVANLPSHTHTVTGGTTGATGNGTALDNRQPSLALHFLIAANGELMIVPWPRQPTGWTWCDGRLLDFATHTFLFRNIGTTYGGNTANFALPDLRGRIVLGDDNGVSWPLGLASGSNDIVLSVAGIPAHTHTLSSGNTGSTGGTGNSANNYQPSLVLRPIISFFGSFPSQGGSSNFPCIGELRLIAGATASGLSTDAWKPLDGVLYAISQYDTLYNLIGTTYGGNGQDTFAVPDLRARADMSALSGIPVGANVGSPTLVITVSQLAPHAHLVDLRITMIQNFSDDSATISLMGDISTSCQVDKSDDLVTWMNLGSVQFTTATQTITDSNPTHVSKRLYRAHP